MRISAIPDGDRIRVCFIDGDAVFASPRSVDRSDVAGWLTEVEQARAADGSWARVDEPTFLAPIVRPGKVIAVGLNYVDHALEGNMEIPKSPLLFTKPPSSIIGPGEQIRWSTADTGFVDFEAELGVVIGRRARRVSAADALDTVLGYTCVNDVSARDLQFEDGQWARGKSLDTFCPVGPVLVTADEIPDPQRLDISCRVNGETLQAANTADMIFPVAEIIAFCSRFFTLEPGDLIATGTPPGVGWFRDPRRPLLDGDVVEVQLSVIGSLTNPCVTEEDAR